MVCGALWMTNVTETDRARVDVLSIVLSALAFGGLVYGLSEFGSEAQARLDPEAVGASVPPWMPSRALRGLVASQMPDPPRIDGSAALATCVADSDRPSQWQCQSEGQSIEISEALVPNGIASEERQDRPSAGVSHFTPNSHTVSAMVAEDA